MVRLMSRLRLAVLCLPLLAAACGGGGNDSPTSPTPPPSLGIPFSSTDMRVGTGAEALNGRRATVNYTGWLYSTTAAENKGTQFDTSYGRTPFAFLVGGGGVIRGWDQGVIGMRVGGQRRLIIPPELGYGSAGSGSTIPGNATLIFEIELLSVQ
jgi:FKBP-type peptidyl-prolyl cis-trans isomerase FkpA